MPEKHNKCAHSMPTRVEATMERGGANGGAEFLCRSDRTATSEALTAEMRGGSRVASGRVS